MQSQFTWKENSMLAWKQSFDLFISIVILHGISSFPYKRTKPENMGGHCCTLLLLIFSFIQLVDFLLPHLSFCRIWLPCSSPLVCWACGPDHSSLWCPQVGDLWWILRGNRGPQGQWRQTPCCAEQGWYDWYPAAHASVWSFNVVSGESVWYSWSSESLHRVLLVWTSYGDRQSQAVWVGGGRSVCWYPESATQRSPTKT